MDRLLLAVKNPLLTFLGGGAGGGVLAAWVTGNMSLSYDIEVSTGRILSYRSGEDAAWNMVSSHFKPGVDNLSTKSKEAIEAFETDDPETRKKKLRTALSHLLSPTSEEHGFLGHNVVFYHGKTHNPIVLDQAEYKLIKGQWNQYVQKFPDVDNDVLENNRQKTRDSPYKQEDVDLVIEACMAHVK